METEGDAEAEGDARSSSTDANRKATSGARHVPSDGAGAKPADAVIPPKESSLRGSPPGAAAARTSSSALPAGSGPTGTGGAIDGRWSEFILALADLTQRYSEEHATSIAKLHGDGIDKKSIKFVTKTDYNQHIMRKLSKLLELNLEAQLAETTEWIRREVLDEEAKALKDQRYFHTFFLVSTFLHTTTTALRFYAVSCSSSCHDDLSIGTIASYVSFQKTRRYVSRIKTVLVFHGVSIFPRIVSLIPLLHVVDNTLLRAQARSKDNFLMTHTLFDQWSAICCMTMAHMLAQAQDKKEIKPSPQLLMNNKVGSSS